MIKSTKKAVESNQSTSRKVKIAKQTPKPIPERKKLRYKKVTGGIFLSATKQVVRKDEIFLAYPEEIPAGFMPSFICLDAITSPTDPGIKVGLSPAGNNLWNVTNTLTGDVLNEKPLDAASAKLFLEEGQELPSPLEPPAEKPVASIKAPTESVKTEEDDEEEYDD